MSRERFSVALPSKLHGLRGEKVLRALPPESLTELEREKLWQFDYQKATQSRYWRALKRAVMLERDDRCELCEMRGPPPLQLHHLTYERLGAELPEDVELLCEACHWREHHSPDGPLADTVLRPEHDHLRPADVTPDGARQCPVGDRERASVP
jgi:5-methylcytosine-specific restriction endonuclease McrA